MKISDLGNWPEKYHVMPNLICKDCLLSNRESSREGYNTALDEVGLLEVTVDEEKAIDIIRKMDWYCKSGIPTTNDILETVQKLSSALPQWLVLKGKL